MEGFKVELTSPVILAMPFGIFLNNIHILVITVTITSIAADYYHDY